MFKQVQKYAKLFFVIIIQCKCSENQAPINSFYGRPCTGTCLTNSWLICRSQWESKIQTSLDFKFSKQRLGCKWSRFRMGSEIGKHYHLKSGQMVAIMSKTIWNPEENVRILNGPVSNGWDYSYGPTIWNLTFKKSGF